eukprot:CAMPEP_0170568172 /NCGR_PEP_ID=MMETSP0211-20121228/80987_1 /TAXON_ID=311385 /ORGANISM="Pseudokeronopsis sp., Strain OXSARD2" /LENGTH=108 /DNA_ID=CAMNT_0010889907 /DNA_START=801 /DNA_END=1127 /DNA_ORIENTATION=-
MKEQGQVFSSGGTDNHILVWIIKPMGVSGRNLLKVLDHIGLTTNQKEVFGGAPESQEIILGSLAVTTRGMKEKEMETIGSYLIQGVQICKKLQQESGDVQETFNSALD